ncbi:hypothetical protein IC620_15090 [Hazenella sp. IB182357]|uniref:HNH/Endo VII superfamily nuclease toxins domain-containing protein n=1 Tax=Polycladospora coralii TaxID=2771432 RepID=A0A926NB66_9BACL|nr:hypothetical protein [Polycladospora coralii]
MNKGDIIIQDHGAGHVFPDGKGSQVPHFNIRKGSNVRTGSVKETKDHYNFRK